MNGRIIKQIKLKNHHQPTGAVNHYIGSHKLPAPKTLQIFQYDDDPGFYLFYCDSEGNEMTDTYHDSLEQALEQAKREFSVQFDEWEA